MKTISRLIALSTIISLNSCINEDFTAMPSKEEDPDVIKVRAEITPAQNTRDFFDLDYEGVVDKGTFYLTYPRNTVPSETMSYTKYDMATVTFGDEEDRTTGYASFMVNGVKKDLKWTNIKGEGGSSVSLFMHNINPDNYTISTSTSDYNTTYKQKYIFKTASNPYVASPLDTINGSNDLIISGYSATSGGGTSAKRNSGDIIFKLFHRMALLKVDLEIYSATDGHVVSLDNAIVTITNLNTSLKSINLYYSYDSYFVEKEPSSSAISYNLIGDRKVDPDGVILAGSQDEGSVAWGEIILDQEYFDEEGYPYRKDTYSTQPFIFPPQAINNDYPPRVVVKIPKEDVTGSLNDRGEWVTYSGYLPNVMYEPNADGEYTTPLTTRLNNGYVLHVTASIDSPDAELSFAPVKVENWVSKGAYALTTKKAGIYNAKDFSNLIQAYRSGNIYALEQYGFKTGDDFVFQIWANIFLDTEEIAAQMAPDLWPGADSFNFSFLLNNYTVTLDRDTDNETRLEDLDGQHKLYDIVTGTSEAKVFGIHNSQEMADLIKLCHASEEYTSVDKSSLLKYGNLNSFDNVWEFYLQDDISIDFETIYKGIDTAFLTGDFKFNRQGHSITLTIGGKELECEYYDDGYDEFQRLCKVPTATYGIYNAGDFYLLTKCYNNLYAEKPELLEMFGVKSTTSETWTFYFRASMTLQGSRAFLSMTADPDNNKPNYSFYTGSTYYDITFEDPLTPFTDSSRYTYIYKAISGTGGGNSKETLQYIINYYNANNYKYLWNYGKFENGAWLFPLTYSSTSSTSRQQITYDNLFGKMQPDSEDGKYDFNFFIGSVGMMVTGVPQGNSTRYFYQGGSSSYTYPNSEADLKKMALGTYWDEDDVQP